MLHADWVRHCLDAHASMVIKPSESFRHPDHVCEYRNMNSTRTDNTSGNTRPAVICCPLSATSCVEEGPGDSVSALYKSLSGGALARQAGRFENSGCMGLSWQRAGPADCTAAARRRARHLPAQCLGPCGAKDKSGCSFTPGLLSACARSTLRKARECNRPSV